MISLSVDLLGADTDERELCRGTIEAMKKDPDLFLYLCGHADALAPLLAEHPELAGHYALVDSPAALTNYDNPMEGYKNADASMVKAMTLVRDSSASGVVTCGATGEVLVSSIMLLGKLKGLRPILAVELKNAHGDPLLLLDCGANIDSRPELYVSFAHLGDAYMKSIGYPSPRISLLSNGAEDTKGCEAVKEANKLLHALPICFEGNIEPTAALSGKTDVIVCDGFHGNILLKSIEGVAKAVIAEIGEKLPDASPEVRAALAEVRQKYDYNTQGGAILLGVKAPVMKGHGSATGDAVTAMLARMAALCQGGFIERVQSACCGG